MLSDNIALWVSAAGLEPPYYRFYTDSDGSQELSKLIFNTNNSYTFYRLNEETSHPFFISDIGYKQTSSDAILITGDGTPSTGITGDQTFKVEFAEAAGAIEELLYYCTSHTSMLGEFIVSAAENHNPGISTAHDEINRSTAASSINFSDNYTKSYKAELKFLRQYPKEDSRIKITFEPDNGWLNVDGSDPTATYQHIAGLSSPYAVSSPAAPGANARTTLVPRDSIGQHLNGSAGGTIEYIHPDAGGEDTATRVHFSFNNIGHVVSIDEPDLARLNTNSNIDRGINTTSGSDAVAGDDYNQFLEIVPSETSEGGLSIFFSGTTPTGDTFYNPITAFGFYLMGREQKRDVILEVTDIHNNIILEYLTVEPTAANTAVVEYISFAVDEDDAPIASLSLTEEFNDEAGSERDIFSIDDLSIIPAKEILFLHSIDDVSTQKSIKSFTLSKPVFLGSQDVYTVITGTNKKDKITGTLEGEILSGMKGKDILKGGKGADGFLFHHSGKFGNKHADLIKDFDSNERDSILLDNDLFGLSQKIKFKSYSRKSKAKKAARSKNDFVYDDKKGLLYFNENGKQKGWGNGGLFAKLQGAPKLGADDFTIV